MRLREPLLVDGRVEEARQLVPGKVAADQAAEPERIAVGVVADVEGVEHADLLVHVEGVLDDRDRAVRVAADDHGVGAPGQEERPGLDARPERLQPLAEQEQEAVPVPAGADLGVRTVPEHLVDLGRELEAGGHREVGLSDPGQEDVHHRLGHGRASRARGLRRLRMPHGLEFVERRGQSLQSTIVSDEVEVE